MHQIKHSLVKTEPPYNGIHGLTECIALRFDCHYIALFMGHLHRYIPVSYMRSRNSWGNKCAFLREFKGSSIGKKIKSIIIIRICDFNRLNMRGEWFTASADFELLEIFIVFPSKSLKLVKVIILRDQL